MAEPQLGDPVTLTYDLRDPFTGALTDATVAATARNLDDNATAPVTVNRASLGSYQGTFVPGTAGVWEVTFTASGALTASDSVRVFVAVDASAPAWAPSLRKVGAFVPTRTRRVGTDNSYSGTFDATTEPTAEQVATLIDSACAYVAGRAGVPVVAASYPQLQVAAALWAAYWVELAYPEVGGGVSTAADLRTDAEAAIGHARDFNLANGGGGSITEEGAPSTLVTWAFPAPPRYADRTL
jgi:hypothetical protein